ncbi:MAG: glycosyltransferase family 4 protein [Methylophilus sp.]|nr:glycosyltransferase family 4 protein [Methylophilus sp.]
MRPLNILIVCEHASNVFGGEAMLPLNYFRLLSKTEHHVYLITHERVRASILQLQDIDQNAVFYLPDTAIHQFLFKCSGPFPERVRVVTFGFLIHLVTQFYQWRVARKVIKAKNIDVIHEPAPVSATQPSVLFGLGKPVIIGPMNGGMSFPDGFEYMSGKLEKVLYKCVRVFSTIYNLLIPGKFFADLLLVANQRTRDSLPKFRLGRVVEMVENGVFTVKDAPLVNDKTSEIHVLFVGRLVDWKAVDIVIDAVALTNTKVKLVILGDGPERGSLEHHAKQKPNINVQFLGMVPHAEVNAYYDQADIFVLPSLRECGGAVVLEAMSRGLPVIATNWGGPADYITSETGFLINPLSRDYLVKEFARVIDVLAENPSLRYNIGAAAIQRIKQHFMWESKINSMIQHYQEVVQRHAQ